MNGQEWHDGIEATASHLSMEDKKEKVNGKLRTKMLKEINEQQIAIEDFRLKYELASQENTVLKQTVIK